MTTEQKKFAGGCLCGDVRYECGAEVSDAAYCHCESCRRASGANAVAWMTVSRDTFRFTSDAPMQFASSPPVRRTFCGRCGATLTYWHEDSPDTIDVTVATLENAGEVVPAGHIWMSDALAWDQPRDGLPQFEGWRNGG